MATNQVGSQPRQSHAQLVNTIRRQVNWNDANIGAAGGSVFGQLPQGAFITQMYVEIVTAFNGTTPSLTIGTNASADNMVIAGDVDEATPGVYDIKRPLGRSFTAADVTNLAAKSTIAGGTQTQGQAEIVVCYEANLG